MQREIERETLGLFHWNMLCVSQPPPPLWPTEPCGFEIRPCRSRLLGRALRRWERVDDKRPSAHAAISQPQLHMHRLAI